MMAYAGLILILHKAIDMEIAYKLHASEFRCQCTRITCNKLLISPRLRTSWNKSRSQFGKPLKVNSGHRCDEHNAEVGGVEESMHTKGEAIDISHDEFQPHERYRLSKILEENFDVVIAYPTFFHCHNENKIKGSDLLCSF
jgi:zinc D-Ala-D-Ala carboxypeptidase